MIITAPIAELQALAMADAKELGFPKRGTRMPGCESATWPPISETPGGDGWSTARIAPQLAEDGTATLAADTTLETSVASKGAKAAEKTAKAVTQAEKDEAKALDTAAKELRKTLAKATPDPVVAEEAKIKDDK